MRPQRPHRGGHRPQPHRDARPHYHPGRGQPHHREPPRKGPSLFESLTAVQPNERLRLETEPSELSMRVFDMIAPLGKGQRGLIVAAPRTGKTTLIQKVAKAVLRNHPEVVVLVLLIDERPEEVTDFRMTLRGTTAEIIASNNDQPPIRHIQLTETTLERAKRLVEAKKDVLLLFDSLTRMTRAYNHQTPQRGRTMTGGIDAAALLGPRSFFGAARKVEQGGSLTILGTVLVDTGSRMDQIIFEEFKGTGNLELYLNRDLADRRVFPSFDLLRSGTRREELLFAPQELERVHRLRRIMADREPIDAMQSLLEKLGETPTNEAFLKTLG